MSELGECVTLKSRYKGTKSNISTRLIEEVHIVVGVVEQDACNSKDLSKPEDHVSKQGSFEGHHDEENYELNELKRAQVERGSSKEQCQEDLMEENAEEESRHLGLEHRHLVSQEKLKIKMSEKEFVDKFVPFPAVLVEGSCIPVVLVELPVCQSRNVCVEVANKVKADEEEYQVGEHEGNVEGREHFLDLNTISDHMDQRKELALLDFIDKALRERSRSQNITIATAMEMSLLRMVEKVNLLLRG